MFKSSKLVVTLLFTLLSGCLAKTEMGIPARESALTEVAINLPDVTKLTEKQKLLLTHFEIMIVPLPPKDQSKDCVSPKSSHEIKDYKSQTIPSHFLTQGCDYRIGLRLGKRDDSGKSMAKIYYSNVSESEPGKLLEAASFKGKDSLTLDIKLKLTVDGASEGLGGSADKGTLDPGGSLTSLVINVTLEDPLSNPEPLQKPDQLRTIDISVNKGYTPASFNLKLGEKVKLKFTRVSTSGDCASEIVFPDGQKISLATGESKTIEYTAEKAGKSVFACSMNMYQGLMIVN